MKNSKLYFAMSKILATLTLLTLTLELTHAQNIDKPSPAYTGPYISPNKFDQTYIVRTYIVFGDVAAPGEDGFATQLGSAEIERRTKNFFQYANSVYNEYGIYLVPAETMDPLPPSTTQEDCYWVYSGGGSQTWNSVNPEDGLSIFVENDVNGILGQALGSAIDGIPGKVIQVQGIEAGVPVTSLPVVIHEIGHAFGLVHTFANTTNTGSYSRIEDVCDPAGSCATITGSSDPDYCCGDFCDDTPVDLNELFVELDGTDCCCIVSNPLPPTNDISLAKNYMSWSYPSRCKDHFTIDQIERMRYYLYNSTKLNDITIDPELFDPLDDTWNSARSIYSNFIVDNGEELTINSTVDMAPNTYFIVKRGGKLTVNGTITSTCGMWGGIVVEGNGSQSQLTPTNQGQFILSSSGVIEHALRGVGVHGFGPLEEDDDYDGGIAQLSGIIRNCTEGVRIGSYAWTSLPNESSLTSLGVILNNDYKGSTSVEPIMVYLDNINKVDILGCLFRDNRTQTIGGIPPLGLRADDAGFRIQFSFFVNLNEGVHASPLLGSNKGAFEVLSSSFLNCRSGIYASLPEMFTIKGNTFQVAKPALLPSLTQGFLQLYGLTITGYSLPMGIEVSNNSFSWVNIGFNEFGTGTVINSTGGMENFIRANSYSNFFHGNRANGKNAGDNGAGMRYECNDNTGNIEYDFFQDKGGTIRLIQGDVSTLGVSFSTGNKFSSDVGNRLFNNNENPTYTYYFEDNISDQDPLMGTSDNFLAIEADQPNQTCETTQTPCEEVLCEVDYETVRSDFNQNASDWVTKQAQQDALTDTTAIDSLQIEINRHRSNMDIYGGKIIRFFTFDSLNANPDSALWWTEQIYRYETDTKLLRHAFFSADSAGYAQWKTVIPQRHSLDSSQTAELASLISLLDYLQQFRDSSGQLNPLSISALDSIEYWKDACNEAGWVALTILSKHGRHFEPNCVFPVLERADQPDTQKVGLNETTAPLIYPNPTTGQIFINVPYTLIELYNSSGQLMFQNKDENQNRSINIGQLPPGLYWCRIWTKNGESFTKSVTLN